MARIESGSAFHVFAVKYWKDLRPCLVLLTLGNERMCQNCHCTSVKTVVMATALRVSFCFFCDGHLWCQVSRTPLQYFQRYRLFSFHHFSVGVLWHHWSNLHNSNTSISLKRKKVISKRKMLFFCILMHISASIEPINLMVSLDRSFPPAEHEYKWCQFWSKVMTS